MMKNLSDLKDSVSRWEEFFSKLEDLEALVELCEEEPSLKEELEENYRRFVKEYEKYDLQMKLSGKEDPKNAIVSINPGAGGTESQDWAEMLLRMYTRYCEEQDYRVQYLDYQHGEEAGIKSAAFLAEGLYAYGHLKSETGVHRLVRLSPYDANHRRHTSFASVFVVPEISDDVEIDIEPNELRIDTYRASGAGGQHVNVTDSAVRITHIPTGITVQCQNERSQHRNREVAMKVLRSRLYDLKMKEMEAERDKLHQEKKEIAWGSQVRSYVLHPYRLIKDHRTGEETGNVDAVLDGDLHGFVESYLRWKQS